jgi:hypothetical protein
VNARPHALQDALPSLAPVAPYSQLLGSCLSLGLSMKDSAAKALRSVAVCAGAHDDGTHC